MGNKVLQQKIKKERERELQMKSSTLDCRRFSNMKHALSHISASVELDDASDETNKSLMTHFFNPAARKVRRNPLKQRVSQNKIRFCNDFFDLDLSYITKRVIAMGFPSTGLESVYRNSREDVMSFLNTYHFGHHKVYNLCQELNRYYPISSLAPTEVAYFPIVDHEPTNLIAILEFCVDVSLYLLQHPENVVAVHCKAGKGRTGLMICAFLIFAKVVGSAQEAIELYGKRRATDKNGLTIPSQCRYVHYFHMLLEDNLGDQFLSRITALVCNDSLLKKIKVSISKDFGLISLNVGPGTFIQEGTIQIGDFENRELWKGTVSPTQFMREFSQFALPCGTIVNQDFSVSFKSRELSFKCWVNCYFFKVESSRVHAKQPFSMEIASDFLDNLETSFSKFCVTIMAQKRV